METPIVVAFIAAVAGIAGAIVTFSLTKKKEREAEWRKHKLEHYKELINSMSEIVFSEEMDSARSRFISAANAIFMVGSPEVLVALKNLMLEVSQNSSKRSQERHDALLTALMFAIRDDVGIKPNKPQQPFTFALISSKRRAN